MSRHHTISYPRQWIDAVGDAPGYWRESYQEDVAFTPEEEDARDGEEVKAAEQLAAKAVRDAEYAGLMDELRDGTITPEGQIRIMQMDKGMS
mgnify:CR=1 FL=1